MTARPATSCLINNFNYGEFVGDAINGALNQTAPLDEIIVVDDGSTDGSFEMMTSKYGKTRNVQIVGKPNGGQLSCFNEGFAHATGEIVFFLDADDIYELNYVASALEVYREHPSCDFLACGRQMFGRADNIKLELPTNSDLGYSKVVTALRGLWIGGSTSTLSIRRRVLEKLLPLPFIEDWRVRADDCLVFGSSLAGAHKRYVAQPLVRYRVHDRNHYYYRRKDYAAAYCRSMAISTLFEHCARKFCYNPARLAALAHSEFRTIERPTFSQLLQYLRIYASAQLPLVQKLSAMSTMCTHYGRASTQRKATRTNTDEAALERHRLAA